MKRSHETLSGSSTTGSTVPPPASISEENHDMAQSTRRPLKAPPSGTGAAAAPDHPTRDAAYWNLVREQAYAQRPNVQGPHVQEPHSLDGREAANSRRQVEELKHELAALGIIDPRRPDAPAPQTIMDAVPAPLQPGATSAAKPPIAEAPAAEAPASDHSVVHRQASNEASRPAPGSLMPFARLVAPLRSVGAGLSVLFKAHTEKNPSVEAVISSYRRDMHWRNLNKLTPFRFFGWSLWAMTVSLALYMAVFDKDTVTRYWPQSTAFFALFERTLPTDSLGVDNISHRYAFSVQGPVLEVRGILTNPGTDSVANPAVQVIALNGDGEETGAWLIDPEIKTMHPQMEIPFVGRSRVPAGTTDVTLDTVSKDDVASYPADITSDIFSLQPVSGGWKQSAPSFD